jgi:hypothetical protein
VKSGDGYLLNHLTLFCTTVRLLNPQEKDEGLQLHKVEF